MNTGALNNEASTSGRRFILVRTLGEGTFGSVYLADMVSTGGFRKRVALKMLNANWDPASDAGRRLRDEARLLGRLQNRNIVRVDDLVQVDGRWALLMEYIAGVSLEQIFEVARDTGGQLPQAAVLEMCAGIAVALDAAWNATGDDGVPLRVVHRDIKPSNVLLSELGDIKVLDFGVARAEFAGREAKTERVRYGSIGYMAPERLLGEPETAAGDVYALAVVAYELLTLEPFGRAELAPDAQKKQVEAAIAALDLRLGPELRALTEILGRALDYEPLPRPTAAEVHVALRQALRRAEGDDLVSFAKAFVPGAIAAREKDPLEGTELSEGTTRTAELSRSGAVSASGTIVAPDLMSVEPLPLPPAPQTGRIAAMVAGLVVLLGLGAAGVAWSIWGGDADVSAQTAIAPAVAPSAAPEPSASPASPAVAPPPEAATASAEPASSAVSSAASASAEPAPGAASSAPAGAPRPSEANKASKPGAPATTASAAATPTPSTPVVTPAPEPALAPPDAAVRTLRAAKFSLTGGTGLRVRCGNVSQTGDVSVLLKEFPAGTCTVGTDGGLATTVTVDAPRGVNCAVNGGVLTCQ